MGEQRDSLSGRSRLEMLSSGGKYVRAMIKASQMFNELADHEIDAIARNAWAYKAEAGTTLIREGEPGGRLFLLMEGKVDIYKESEQGSPRKITEIHPGGTLGEMSMVDALPFSATAIAAETTVFISIGEEDFNRLAAELPETHLKILKRICREMSMRLRHTTHALSNYLGRVADLTESLHFALANNRSKTNFIASMSHELRTPLNAIIGFSEIFEEEVRSHNAEENVEDLKRIQIAGRHMLGLINNILHFTKLESGKMAFQLDLFELEPLMEEVMTMMQPLAMVNQNRLTAHRDPDAREMIADPTKVKQALINLVGNACKFTSNGFISVEVKRREEKGKDFIYFAVSDTGIGIPDHEMEQLFESFTQGASVERIYGGSGLGLYISKTICEKMGGAISVESEEGKGSTFTIRIPAHVEKIAS